MILYIYNNNNYQIILILIIIKYYCFHVSMNFSTGCDLLLLYFRRHCIAGDGRNSGYSGRITSGRSIVINVTRVGITIAGLIIGCRHISSRRNMRVRFTHMQWDNAVHQRCLIIKISVALAVGNVEPHEMGYHQSGYQ